MSKDRKFAKTIKAVVGSKDPEILSSPEFLGYFMSEMDKRKMDSQLLFKSKKLIRKLKKPS